LRLDSLEIKIHGKSGTTLEFIKTYFQILMPCLTRDYFLAIGLWVIGPNREEKTVVVKGITFIPVYLYLPASAGNSHRSAIP
jgi:hypothetical protein